MSSGTAPMPTGPVPSLVSTGLIVVSTIFPLLSLISILLRYKARRVGRLTLQADDWWIMFTWVVTFGLSINAWYFGSVIGINTLKINPLIAASKSLQCLLVSSVILQVCLATVKISILFFYKRIFATPKFKQAAWAVITLVSIWGTIFFFLVLLQGDPISASWTGQGRLVVDSAALGLAQAGTSLVFDVMVLCLPIPVIWGLHMRTERKWAIAIILWLGGFCCVAAIVRLALLHQSITIVTGDASSGYDSVYLESKSYIFLILEPNCSIIAASLPCYGPLFAGGRAPESLVRSVRSVLSLASRGSRGSNNSPGGSKAKSSSHKKDDTFMSKDTESQIELQKVSRDWSSQQSSGHNTTHVEPYKPNPDTDAFPGPGISVERSYETRQESV